MRDVAFGQYYPSGSFIHKLDPRTKLIASVVYIVAIFLCTNYYSYLACFVFLATMVLVSRITIKSVLKTVKGVLFIVLITVIINVLFYSDGNLLFGWWIVRITDAGLIFASKMAMRLIFLVIATSLVTLTTTPMNLTDGLENLMTPLKYIKFPVHDVAIIMSIALRFIPSFIEEIDKIMMAQKARGAAFDNGGLIKRAKALLPVLIPLFVSAFRRADELAMALDARCYNATDKRTKMKKLTLTWRDAVAAIVTAVFLTAVILLRLGLFGLLNGVL
ncbi:MAG: energy-coupling factor transporter transmembrane protein EcfT [Clostridia bacterium]|nr:energy-coupling factor transporter transmembrane protein EcfT [Clostridia bacterium]